MIWSKHGGDVQTIKMCRRHNKDICWTSGTNSRLQRNSAVADVLILIIFCMDDHVKHNKLERLIA